MNIITYKNLIFKQTYKLTVIFLFFYFLLLINFTLSEKSYINNLYDSNEVYLITEKNQHLKLITEKNIKYFLFKKNYTNKAIVNKNDKYVVELNYLSFCKQKSQLILLKNNINQTYTLNIIPQSKNYILNNFLKCEKNIKVSIDDIFDKPTKMFIVIDGNLLPIQIGDK